MSVHVHIERLILHGLPVEHAQAPAIQAAVEAELTRLVAERGIAPGLRNGGALEYGRGGDLRPSPVSTPQGLGRQIAHGIHGFLRS